MLKVLQRERIKTLLAWLPSDNGKERREREDRGEVCV